ncbi:receptor-like protein 7 [Camellia sinensis]|uniref:receptor-like protein 7 n=1 Tax=Camellia sinensis TaxID=4442 RepID=UPI0010368245|nr:receptor-like protein 7 [Camellia sinensis]
MVDVSEEYKLQVRQACNRGFSLGWMALSKKLNIPDDSLLHKADAIPLSFPPPPPSSQPGGESESESEDADEAEDEALITCLHAQLCTQQQTSALLQFKQQFSFNNDASYGYCDSVGILSYPKMESWKEGSDCCSWDGVECDNNTSQVTGLDLSCSWLLGTIHPNSTIFYYFPHLQSLNLAFNDFGMSRISSEFSRFTRLTHLNLSDSSFSGKVPIEVSFLSKLVSLDLSYNLGLRLEEPGFELLVQNLTKVRELNLAHVNISSVVSNSLLNLTSLTRYNSILGLQLTNIGVSKFNLQTRNFSIYFSILDLQKNNFSGIIPDTFAKENSFETINLDSNGFEGPVPKSLENCKMLQVLDLGHNKFSDKFPYWLGNLTSLQVLILRSNKFHGPIPNSKFKFPFPNLRVMDLSNNYFTGPLPRKYFKNLNAMMNVDEASFELQYLGTPSHSIATYYYNDCLTIIIKGSIIEMVKVLTIFTAIDLSKNNFKGEIPQIIGKLNSIRGLNLSHNNLSGHIPASLANLTMLEWLDLSSNKLTGEIPQQLRNLKSLEVLNLSQNQLIGPIPQGNQFDTFSIDSYIDNLALCGPPLLNACNPRTPQPPPLMFQQEDNTSSGLNWEVILPGYICGLVWGLVMGYFMFSRGKPQWLVRIIEGERNKSGKRFKKHSHRNRASYDAFQSDIGGAAFGGMTNCG